MGGNPQVALDGGKQERTRGEVSELGSSGGPEVMPGKRAYQATTNYEPAGCRDGTVSAYKMECRTKQAVPRGTTTEEAPSTKFSLKEKNRLEHEKKTKKRERKKKNCPEDVTGDIGNMSRHNLLTCLYISNVFVRAIGISDAC